MRVKGATVLLSGRESEVAVLLYEGLTNRQIASRLEISVHTANSHVGGMLRGLRLGSRSGLVLWCAQHPRAWHRNEWADESIHAIGCICEAPYCIYLRGQIAA